MLAFFSGFPEVKLISNSKLCYSDVGLLNQVLEIGPVDFPLLGSGLTMTEASPQVSGTEISWLDAKVPMGLRPDHVPATYSTFRPV